MTSEKSSSLPPVIVASSLIDEGERNRDIGMSVAAARHPDKVTLGCISLVRALLNSPTHTATIDDATSPDDLAHAFVDGGMWRGSVTRTVVADGYAKIVGHVFSRRPSAHRRRVALLQLADAQAASRYLAIMSTIFATNEATPTAATVEVVDSNSSITSTGETTDGTL